MQALHEIAKCANKDPNLKLFYDLNLAYYECLLQKLSKQWKAIVELDEENQIFILYRKQT